MLAGIVLMIWGAISWDGAGNRCFIAGLALASLGGLELSVREHFAGYRSHTTLLSGVAAFVVISALVLAAGFYLWVLLAVGWWCSSPRSTASAACSSSARGASPSADPSS